MNYKSLLFDMRLRWFGVGIQLEIHPFYWLLHFAKCSGMFRIDFGPVGLAYQMLAAAQPPTTEPDHD